MSNLEVDNDDVHEVAQVATRGETSLEDRELGPSR